MIWFMLMSITAIAALMLQSCAFGLVIERMYAAAIVFAMVALLLASASTLAALKMAGAL